MDKYEFNIKVEQIKKMVSRGDYGTAMKIADTIDWHRVRNASLLSMIAQIYEKNEEYQEAKDILLLAFERAPVGKRLLYKLADLALKCLNYLLIYGNLGFPEMGVRGAACATLIARCVELIIVIWFLKYRENVLNLNLRKLLHIDMSYVHDYMKVSLPVLINQALWGVAQMVQTGILGHLGGDVTAANAISVQVYQVLSVVCYGAASAAGIVVGRTIGEDNEKKLHPLVTTLQVLFISIGLCSGLAIFLLRGPILAAFGGTLTENAYRLSRQFMLVLAITTVGTSYQMACDNGIIRGGGDTAFSAKMNLVSMWCIIVPFSAMAAFWWKCPPVAVFFLLKWDQLYKAIPVGIRLHSWKWVKKVTRV